MKTLILDNYDSFTYNLYQYVGELGGEPVVVRNDEITIEDVDAMCRSFNRTQDDTSHQETISHIIISPGPGNPYTPRDIGISEELIDYAVEQNIPLLGVCLGHQVLGKHFGATVSKAPMLYHGKASAITFSESRSILFADLPDQIEVMRYHSLHVEEAPKGFRVTAQTDDPASSDSGRGIIMAMEHEEKPLFGIQFHPESIGTPEGKSILQSFLSLS